MLKNIYLPIAIAFAFAFTTVLATQRASTTNEQTGSSNQREGDITSKAIAAEARNVMDLRRDFSISVTMVNHGSVMAVVQQNYLFPDAVEVKSFNLQENGYKAKTSEYDQRLTQWVGGEVFLSPSVAKQADMTYINRVAQAVNQGAKTFQKLATTILVKEGDSVGGQISSPNYPTSYPNGADLTWLIVYQVDDIVELEMLFYDIEECCDHLTIYDGIDVTNHPLATFQGLYTPGSSDNVVYSTQPQMFIRFSSDCTTTSRGFRASYINQRLHVPPPPMSCGSVQSTDDNSGIIQSPNYPDSYAENMNCTWPVETSVNTRVKFSLDEFMIGNDDLITFYDGTPNTPGNKITTLTSNSYPGYQIYASKNQAFVLFSSGSSPNDVDKFVISYMGENYPETTVEPTPESTTPEIIETTTVIPDPCPNAYYTSDTGYVESPNYPNNYDNDMHCNTWVTTSQNTHILLTVQYFSLNSGDHVYIYDGNTGQYMTTFSGGYAYGYSWKASTNSIRINFVSNLDWTSTGYSFYYESVSDTYTPAPSDCGGPMPFNSGSITTTAFGIYQYANNLDCVWTVAVSANKYILFTIEFFRTEDCCDTVSFYGGVPTNNPPSPVANLQGSVSAGTEIKIADDQAWVSFKSDSSVGDNGFDIAYQAVGTEYIVNVGVAYAKQQNSDIINGQVDGTKSEDHLKDKNRSNLPQPQTEGQDGGSDDKETVN